MSARPQRIEVITRGERRRCWSLEEKQAIVVESTGLLYAWRHQAFISHDLNAVSFPSVVTGRPLVLCPCRDPQIGVESRRRGRYTNFYQLRGTARSQSLSL
jgi:hypothetical protein